MYVLPLGGQRHAHTESWRFHQNAHKFQQLQPQPPPTKWDVCSAIDRHRELPPSPLVLAACGWSASGTEWTARGLRQSLCCSFYSSLPLSLLPLWHLLNLFGSDDFYNQKKNLHLIGQAAVWGRGRRGKRTGKRGCDRGRGVDKFRLF